MSAVFTRFDHFMTVFVAAFAVVWSTVFMPLLGGPMHTYEARAIGVGWQSLRTGEAASLSEALEIAASMPAEVLLPSAAAQPPPSEPTIIETAALELLGAPDGVFAIEAAQPAAWRGADLRRAASMEPNFLPHCKPVEQEALCRNDARPRAERI